METENSEIYKRIIPLLSDIVEDWELDDWDEAVSPQTRLIADLGLTSVDFVDLFVAIEKDLGRTVGFHDLLMVDGKYIEDLSLEKLAAYLGRKLNDREPPQTTSQQRRPAADSPSSTVNPDKIERFKSIIPQPGARPEGFPKNKKAVFLLSASRSGSTLLQVILAGHPNLFAPPELHLLWFYDLKQRRMVYSHDANKHLISGAIRAMMELDGLSVEQATAFLLECEDKGMTTTEFYGVMQQRLGDRLLVDKTPSYAYTMDILRRAELDFDEPLFIHLVRHPCGMLRSFTDAHLERTLPFMLRHQDEFSPADFAELAWLTCNRNIVEFLDTIPASRHHRVHYEDLVTHPEDTLRGICGFLGLELHPDMLNPYQDKAQRMADGVGTVSQMSGDLKFHLHTRIEPDAAYRWRQYLDDGAVSDVTWQFANTLGYKREH